MCDPSHITMKGPDIGVAFPDLLWPSAMRAGCHCAGDMHDVVDVTGASDIADG